MISDKPIGRLSIYRRLLNGLMVQGIQTICSHELASMARVTAAQVRRDIMNIGYSGNPNRGYEITKLIESIGKFLDAPEGHNVGLIGIGNLGRSIIDYFAGRRPKLTIVAAFDNDPAKIGMEIQGCRCYSINDLKQTISELRIHIVTICVPAIAAQKVVEKLAKTDIKGILNFAPVPLQVPDNIYVEDIDITKSLEKVAYFARNI